MEGRVFDGDNFTGRSGTTAHPRIAIAINVAITENDDM
jgi:hypothetical protein